MPDNELIYELTAELAKSGIIISPATDNYNQMLALLSERINSLITDNFSLLIAVLYRLDISEKKLKLLLNKSQDISAGDIIAGLIIERQQQKIKSKQAFKNQHLSDEEKW